MRLAIAMFVAGVALALTTWLVLADESDRRDELASQIPTQPTLAPGAPGGRSRPPHGVRAEPFSENSGPAFATLLADAPAWRVRIVRGEDPSVGVPGAEVRFLDEGLSHATADSYPHGPLSWSEAMRRSFPAYRSDALGWVRLPRRDRGEIVARCGGLAGRLTVLPGVDASGALLRVQAMTPRRIKLLEPDGTPAAGLEVELFGGLELYLRARTDAAGLARLDDPMLPQPDPANPRQIRLRSPLLWPGDPHGIHWPAPSTWTAEPHVLRLPPTGSLRVRVKGPDDAFLGDRVPLVHVDGIPRTDSMAPADEDFAGARYRIQREMPIPGGERLISHVPLGLHFHMEATLGSLLGDDTDPDSFALTLKTRGPRTSAAGPMKAGEVVSFEVSVASLPAHLSLRLLDPVGEPLSRRRLCLSLMEVDAQGAYKLLSEPSFTHTDPRGFVQGLLPEPAEATSGKEVHLGITTRSPADRGPVLYGILPLPRDRLGSSVTRTLRLGEAPVAVRGVVVDARGQPIPSAEVTAVSGQGEDQLGELLALGQFHAHGYGAVRVDARGRFVLHKPFWLRPLSVLDVRANGFEPLVFELDVERAREPVRIVLSRGAVVEGQLLTDLEGIDWQLGLEPRTEGEDGPGGGAASYRCHTRRDGERLIYYRAGVSPGTYDLIVSARTREDLLSVAYRPGLRIEGRGRRVLPLIDLRGRLRKVGLRSTSSEESVTVSFHGFRDFPAGHLCGSWQLSEEATAFVVPADGSLLMTVSRPGFLTEVRPAPLVDTALRLRPAPRIRLRARGIPAGASEVSALLLLQEDGALEPVEVGEITETPAEVVIPRAGRYRLRWTRAVPWPQPDVIAMAPEVLRIGPDDDGRSFDVTAPAELFEER